MRANDTFLARASVVKVHVILGRAAPLQDPTLTGGAAVVTREDGDLCAFHRRARESEFGIDTIDPTYYTVAVAMGKRRRRPKQTSAWVATQDRPRSAVAQHLSGR